MLVQTVLSLAFFVYLIKEMDERLLATKCLKLQFKMGSIPSCQSHADTTQVRALS